MLSLLFGQISEDYFLQVNTYVNTDLVFFTDCIITSVNRNVRYTFYSVQNHREVSRSVKTVLFKFEKFLSNRYCHDWLYIKIR